MQFNPYPYQQFCYEQLINHPSMGLFLDMGLGKTIITLLAIKELKYGRFQVAKVLVIAPKKVAEATWQQEAAKWNNVKSLRISTVLGTEKQRIKAIMTPADIYVINRENVVWLVDYYKNNWPFDMVVADESSSFKSHKAKRFKALAAIRSHIKRMVCLTGTPTPNGLLDLWSQVYLLDRGKRLGEKFTHYRERFFEPGQRNRTTIFSWDPKDCAWENIMAKVSDICISMKSEDYLQLPEIVYDDIPVQLDSKATGAYNELEKKMVLNLISQDKVIDVASAAALSNKLQQLANGAVYDDAGRWYPVHDCKIEAFLELLEKLHGKPALVFYNFRHDLERITKVLNEKTNLVFECLEGAKEMADWNAGKLNVLLAHPASCAYGLNLQQGGNHVIWFGLNWSLELYQQANKRLHRQGQKERVIVHHLLCRGTRDDDLITALGKKDKAQQFVLESLKARIDKYREAEK